MDTTSLAIIVIIIIILVGLAIWALIYLPSRPIPLVVPPVPPVPPPGIDSITTGNLTVTNNANIRKLDMPIYTATVPTSGQVTLIPVTEKQGMITLTFTTPVPANNVVKFLINHPDITTQSLIFFERGYTSDTATLIDVDVVANQVTAGGIEGSVVNRSTVAISSFRFMYLII